MTALVKPPSATKMAVRTAVILLLFVVVFTGLLSAAYLQTQPTIAAAAAEEKMKLIDEVLPRASYDNDLLKDALQLPASSALGQDEAGPDDEQDAIRPRQADGGEGHGETDDPRGRGDAQAREAEAPQGRVIDSHLLEMRRRDRVALGEVFADPEVLAALRVLQRKGIDGRIVSQAYDKLVSTEAS